MRRDGFLAAEYVLDLGEDALVAIGGWLIELLEALEELLLLGVEALRRSQLNVDVEVAAAVAAQVGDALAAQRDHLAALGAGGDLELVVALKRGDFELVAQRGLREADV